MSGGSSINYSVRGQSVFLNLALTERNMQIKFDLKLSVYSLGVDSELLIFVYVHKEENVNGRGLVVRVKNSQVLVNVVCDWPLRVK